MDEQWKQHGLIPGFWMLSLDELVVRCKPKMQSNATHIVGEFAGKGPLGALHCGRLSLLP